MGPTLALLLLVCGGYASGQLKDDRPNLVGPYHVSLQVNGRQYCGGTIVDDRWILTAGKCYNEYSKENSTAVVGTNNLQTGGTSYLIDRFIVHSRFHSKQFGIPHNIALVRLTTPLVYNKFVDKIEISDKHVPDNATLSSVGTDKSINMVKALPQEECLRQYHNTIMGPFVNVGNLCTVNPADQRPTFGITGSGLILEGKLVGVFRSPGLLGRYSYPNANTRVSYYHDWIQTTIANNGDEAAKTDRPSVRN
uniref:Uncharacterized protein n=1 Tax=Anopheles atroparvus TaxID=41427 RepID=A0A182J7V1_ANOAO